MHSHARSRFDQNTSMWLWDAYGRDVKDCSRPPINWQTIWMQWQRTSSHQRGGHKALRSFRGRSKWKCLDDIWAAGQVETFLTTRLWFLVAMDSSCKVQQWQGQSSILSMAQGPQTGRLKFRRENRALFTTQYWHSAKPEANLKSIFHQSFINLSISWPAWNRSFGMVCAYYGETTAAHLQKLQVMFLLQLFIPSLTDSEPWKLPLFTCGCKVLPCINVHFDLGGKVPEQLQFLVLSSTASRKWLAGRCWEVRGRGQKAASSVQSVIGSKFM